jgi:NitT/TauT family transport system substrate-binding protein
VEKIRIAHLTTSYHTAFILMGSGCVEESMGQDVEWRLFPTGPEMIKAFIRGEVDIGYIGLPPAMIGISKGLQVKCVAGGHMEGTILTAKKGFNTLSEIGDVGKTLSQFRGKTIGVPTKGSIHDVIIRWMIEENGLQEDVQVKNFDWADFILDAMEEGVVEGGAGTPPLAVLASKFLSAKTILPPHKMWPHNPSYGIVSTVEMLEHHPDTLGIFLQMHEEACNLIREQPKRAAEMAAKAIGIGGMVDEKFILDVYRISPKYCASLSRDYVESTLAFVPVLQKMGYISKPLSREDVFYPEIVEGIHEEGPHYENLAMLRSDRLA